MNAEQQLIKDTLGRIFADHAGSGLVDKAEAGDWPGTLWQALTETGLTLAGIDETCGGAGGQPADAMLVIREAARHAAPVPLAEHFMAARLLELQGASLNAPIATVAAGDFALSADGKLRGAADKVAFARWCSHILVIACAAAGDALVLVPVEKAGIKPAVNIAGEPRDRVEIDARVDPSRVVAASALVRCQLELLGAATRSLMMAGAMESILELSVQYALERVQFGRPIAKFQAIQQQLAILAGLSAAATTAAHGVSAAVATLDEVDIAIGKARIGEAVAEATDIAHQVHGAMGYTMEHALNHRTRRLWCWRDEYGGERAWQQLVGRAMMADGAGGLWGQVTARN